MDAGEGHDHREGDRFQEKIVAAKNTAYLENHSKRSRRLRGRDIREKPRAVTR